MYTKQDLLNDIHNMGLQPTDAIMVHSSMKSIGPVEGGADTVVDAFMEYFKDGLFMTPTHTWAQMGAEHSLFDPQKEQACVGIIPNIFRQRDGVVRSLHPTHSIAAYGPKAAEYVKGEENITTPAQPGGCWSRLMDVDAKILLLGCTHNRNTFMHAVEELLDVPERLTEEPERFRIVMPDGDTKEVFVHRHYNAVQPHISEEFDKLAQAFYDLGAARKVKFGDADCILCEARKIYDVMNKVLSHEINCLIERQEIPREWWMNKQAVYDYLTTIPKGKVVTYGQIGESLGSRKLARTVGNILHQNPDGEKYPCYKVVNAQGRLSAQYAFGGMEAQKQKLEAEGIVVEKDKVDLKMYRWEN